MRHYIKHLHKARASGQCPSTPLVPAAHAPRRDPTPSSNAAAGRVPQTSASRVQPTGRWMAHWAPQAASSMTDEAGTDSCVLSTETIQRHGRASSGQLLLSSLAINEQDTFSPQQQANRQLPSVDKAWLPLSTNCFLLYTIYLLRLFTSVY